MKVLVTGATGFVGHHVVEHLLRTTSWNVVGVGSFRHRGKPTRLTHLLDNPRFEFAFWEMQSEWVPTAAANCRTIINCASESAVDRSIESPSPFVLNNVEIMLRVLELARLFGSRLLHLSTDEVYGPQYGDYQAKPYDPILPSNPYAASKAAQEALAIAWWRTYGVPVQIVNSMNIFGERQDPEKFIPKLVGAALSGSEVEIHNGSRMWIHARNLADAMVYILERIEPAIYRDDPTAQRPDRFHVVGLREVTNTEMAASVGGILGKSIRCDHVDTHAKRPGHDRRYALKSSLPGWTQPVDFEESLERTVRWTADNRQWLQL